MEKELVDTLSNFIRTERERRLSVTDPKYHECLKYWERTELSTRIINCLAMRGIDSIEVLMQYSNSELLRIDNFGYKSLRELREWLNRERKIRAETVIATLSDLTDEQLLHEIARRMRRPRNEN